VRGFAAHRGEAERKAAEHAPKIRRFGLKY